MDTKAKLMALEADFWQASADGDADTIAGILADDARLIGSFGVLDKATTVDINRQGQGAFLFWEIQPEPELVTLTPTTAAVIYRAKAQRPEQEPFTILMSSTYTVIDNQWQLILHHQTML